MVVMYYEALVGYNIKVMDVDSATHKYFSMLMHRDPMHSSECIWLVPGTLED